MPIPDVQKLTFEIIADGTILSEGAGVKNWNSVFHYKRTSGSPVLSKLAVALAFEAKVAASLQAALNHTWTCETVRVRCLEDITDPFLDHTIPAGGWIGGVAGDRLPPDNTAFMLLKTDLRGRSYRAPKYWSPMSESDTTAGTADLWNAAAMTRLTALATAISTTFTDSNTNVFSPQVVSRKLSSYVPVPANVFATPVSSVVVRLSIGRFKRRSPTSVY